MPVEMGDWQQLALDLRFERSSEFSRWRGRDQRWTGQYRLVLEVQQNLLARVQREGVEGPWPELVPAGVQATPAGSLVLEAEARLEGGESEPPLQVRLLGDLGAAEALGFEGMVAARPLAEGWLLSLGLDLPLQGQVSGLSAGESLLGALHFLPLVADPDTLGSWRLQHALRVYPGPLASRPAQPDQAMVYDSLRNLLGSEPGTAAVLNGVWQGAVLQGAAGQAWEYSLDAEQGMGDEEARVTDRLRVRVVPVARTLPLP